VSHLSDGKLGIDAIDPKGHIFDCGYVDSFRSAELLSFIEKRFGVSIPEVQLVGALCTLDAIARHVAGKRG
jgi:acyl carrier protein